MFRKITRTLAALMIPMLMCPNNEAVGVFAKTETVKPNIKSYEYVFDNIKLEKRYSTGWTTVSVNVRKGPSTNTDILDTYTFNKKVKYVEYNDEWVKIKYKNSTAYMCKKYISKHKKAYTEFDVPYNSGFKSYMDYKCITSTGSKQYKLQHSSAYTGKYGIRQINGRYCVAVGSHFTTDIGTSFDLVLENGTVIPCILADAKADKDTDYNNIVTAHNGCVSEFVVDTNSLYRKAKLMGDISYCNDEWNSPVKKIRVYD